MKLGEITQSFVCSLFSVSETDRASEQGEILMDPAVVPTVLSLMSRLISLTLTTTSCLYFCSWQDSALTNVSRAGDRHRWLLRHFDSRSKWVDILSFWRAFYQFVPNHINSCMLIFSYLYVTVTLWVNMKTKLWRELLSKIEVTTWKDHDAESSSNPHLFYCFPCFTSMKPVHTTPNNLGFTTH